MTLHSQWDVKIQELTRSSPVHFTVKYAFWPLHNIYYKTNNIKCTREQKKAKDELKQNSNIAVERQTEGSMLSPKPCSSPLIVSSFPLNRFVFAGGMHNDLNLIQYSNYCNLPHLIAEAILIKECVPLCHLMVLFRIHQSSALLQCFNLQGKHCGQ